MARLVISLSAADQGPSVELSPREKPLSVGERRRFSEEVLGMAMSFSAYQLLASFFGDHDQNMAPRHSDDWWKGPALLTSFLVYARQIDDFLYPEIAAHPRRADADGIRRIDLGSPENGSTVTSLDLVRDPEEWLKSRPLRGEMLNVARRRINRSVIHLDRSRRNSRIDLGSDHDPSNKKQVWSVSEIWNALQPGLKSFRGCVVERQLCEGFKFYLDKAIRGEAAGLDSLDSYRHVWGPNEAT